MNILGITAEYNPFHNGHSYQLKKAKELTGAECTVVCMSGNFMQRGEPALSDKWIRSRIAVESGADLVIELPFVFACNQARYFGAAAVDILAELGVTHISFGCEANDHEKLKSLAHIMAIHEGEIDEFRREFMCSAGLSSAKAYELAVIKVCGELDLDMDMAIMNSPNNILALEYLKRIEFVNNSRRCQGTDAELKAMPITRFGSGYNDRGSCRGFAGASVIRQMKSDDEIAEFVPRSTLAETGSVAKALRTLSGAKEKAFDILRSRTVTMEAEELAQLYMVGEGFENKLKKEILLATSFDDLVKRCVSKRYTAAAVRRMIIWIMMGIKGAEADKILDINKPLSQYARVLALSHNGRKLLGSLRKGETGIKILTNINREVLPEDSDNLKNMLKIDVLASDIYNIICGKSIYEHSDKVVKPYIKP